MRLARRNILYHRCTTTHYGPFADPNTFLHDRVRANERSVANLHVSAQDGAGGNMRPGAKHATMIHQGTRVDDDPVADSHTWIYHGIRSDEDALAEVCARSNNSLGMNHIDIATKTLPNPIIANGDDEVLVRTGMSAIGVIGKMA